MWHRQDPDIKMDMDDGWRITQALLLSTRSAWSIDQGSNKNNSPINNFTPTVTKCCVMWEGQTLPHDTKFRNGKDSRAFPNLSLIHGSSWTCLIKAEPRCSNAREEGLYDDFFPGDCDILPSMYRKISNIRRTKSQNFNDSHLVLKSPLPNPLKPGVKSRMKM